MKTIVQTPTGNLKDSLEFYSSLKFEILSNESPILVSDGKVIIEINTHRHARSGIKLYDSSWKTTADQLKKISSVIKVDNGYLLGDPNGVFIYLIENKEIPDFDISGISTSVLGDFAGLSIECIDIEKSEEFWAVLGFKRSMGSLENGWIVMVNKEGTSVSLMIANSCPHLFFNPSLTFFNGKNNLAIIEQIRALGVPITEEITCFNEEGIVDNIIVRDPGGLGFFVFND